MGHFLPIKVNNVEVTGQLQSTIVNQLRNVKPGEAVNLVVSRQVVEEEKAPVVPRELVGGDTCGSCGQAKSSRLKTSHEIVCLHGIVCII